MSLSSSFVSHSRCDIFLTRKMGLPLKENIKASTFGQIVHSMLISVSYSVFFMHNILSSGRCWLFFVMEIFILEDQNS